jgi:hypothetical protein
MSQMRRSVRRRELSCPQTPESHRTDMPAEVTADMRGPEPRELAAELKEIDHVGMPGQLGPDESEIAAST